MSKHQLKRRDITVVHSLDEPNIAIEIDRKISDMVKITRHGKHEYVRHWVLLYTDQPGARAAVAA
jgi:hypothetical protein